MLYSIVAVLMIAWLLGIVTSYTLGGFIHLLLVGVLVIVVWRVIRGKKVVWSLQVKKSFAEFFLPHSSKYEVVPIYKKTILITGKLSGMKALNDTFAQIKAWYCNCSSKQQTNNPLKVSLSWTGHWAESKWPAKSLQNRGSFRLLLRLGSATSSMNSDIVSNF